MSKSCKSCGNFVECGSRDAACKSGRRRLAWIPKPSDIIEKRFQKFLKGVNHEDWDKFTLMKFAFEAGVKFGSEKE
jgi:hypothetical protein